MNQLSIKDMMEKCVQSTPAVLSNGMTIFTVSGPIEILALDAECVTANDATASTLQWQSAPTAGAAATFSGASASLANAAAGASVNLVGTALSTAPTVTANGPALGANGRPIYCPAGKIKAVVGVGSTTGTWRHVMRYRPLARGAVVY